MKILFVVANGRNTSDLHLRQELRDVRDEIQRSPNARHIEIHAELAARPMDLTRQLLQFAPDIVHFSGHGVRGRCSLGLSGDPLREFGAVVDASSEPHSESDILLEDASGYAHPIAAGALAKLFEGPRAPRCVVLNACHTSGTARTLAEHVDHVVGMNQAISDQSAITFAQAFYQGLAHGGSVNSAFDTAKAVLDVDIPELHCRWRVRLAKFFATHYTNRELRFLITFQFHGASVSAVLGDDQDHQRNAERVVQWLGDEGEVSELFFQKLAQEPNERFKVEIDDIAASWRRATNFNSWFPTIPPAKGSKTGPRNVAPTPPASGPGILKDPTPQPPKVRPRAKPHESSAELDTHTSIVLDRIEQWQSLVNYCKENRRLSHRIIIVHGSSQQNVGLFTRRIKSYLAAAAKQEHALVEVSRTNDISVARTCEEWKRCIRRAMRVKHGELRDSLMHLTSEMPVLMLFTHNNTQPLAPFDDEISSVGLVQAIKDVDMCLHWKAERFKHSVRIVIPFEWNALRGQTAPPLMKELGRLESLHVTSLPELVFPPWEPDVLKFIRQTHPRADERILERCKGIHAEIARTDRSLKSLSDRIDETMHEWVQRVNDV